MSLVEQLGIEHPVVQAGMGGGIAGGELAGAVSAAGGLGTVGILPAGELELELRGARERAGGAPVAVNLLIPFTTRAHLEACLRAGARAVVLHAGFNRRLVERLKEGGTLVLHTIGTPMQARRALAEGADGLVLQGIEAGGHLVGEQPALQALPSVLAAAGDAPVLLAGGIADGADAARALGAGAVAVVAGTRFLLTDECAAHPAYKQHVLEADHTIETQLFGLGWPMRHRVVPNDATDRWCRGDARGPRSVRVLQTLSVPLARLPLSISRGTIRIQHPAVPALGPAAPLRGMPERVVQASALYAGETALRIDSLLAAAEAVRLLAGVEQAAAPESPTIPFS